MAPEKRSEEVIERQTRAIEASFAALDRMASKFPAEPTIGELAVACAIGYLDLRAPEDGWRERYPRLAGWLEGFSQRPVRPSHQTAARMIWYRAHLDCKSRRGKAI